MSERTIKKVVYLVRHGESKDNVAPVFQSPDSPLSERGLQQAERIAERVSKLTFDALVASPFLRAKETAAAIGRTTRKEPEYSEFFVERIKPTGIYGKAYDDEEANSVWRKWEKSLYTPELRVEDGENFTDIIERADKALDFLTSRPEQSIVVVTHGYFLRTMVARVLFVDLLTGELHRSFQRHADHENTGLTVLRYHGGFEEESSWHLWMYNDHAHLGE
ncbi:histidine phosphatase family protein [Candidatus Kaiserbacteria bacterium]|nr:histidine phosphatase family protein [Candidatus Kaiserbacteria bacterium]